MRYPLWEFLQPPDLFGRASTMAVDAEGVRVSFADGDSRLCATSGLWNVNLGYGNQRVAEAVHHALRQSSYFSLFRAGHQAAVAASGALVELCGAARFGRVIHSTSGGAANDVSMKLARQYFALQRQFRRRVIVGLKGSYHGLTYGSHALTGMHLAQSYYSVDQRYVRHVSPTDPEELRGLLDTEGEQIAAVVVEPVLGTGAIPLPAEMLEALAQLRQEHGFLLVADEVATGFGRTGTYFASAAWGFDPDIMLVSKALTNGAFGAAAVLASHAVCDVFDRHNAVLTHAETGGGHPAVCAAILATIEEMARLDAVGSAARVSAGLDALLAGIAAQPLVAATRGRGCFRAVCLADEGRELSEAEVADVVDAVREAGALVSPGPSCVQLAPALVYRDDHLRELAGCLAEGLDRAAERLARRAAAAI